MANESSGVRGTSQGGLSGEHPQRKIQRVLVAPSSDGEYNTVKVALVPVACWRVDDIRFEFASSFIKPEATDEFQELDALRKDHPYAPLSIFGHADPVGDDASNKTLSGRRAQAVYGMLVRNTDLWEDLYKNPCGQDKWDTDEIQIMLSSLGYYRGPITGKQDPDTLDAIKAFQREQGLDDDGDPGSQTRPKLYKAYMDHVCVDKKGEPYQLAHQEDFLARGADPGGRGDYQGCSEFNPCLLFSQEEEAEYQKSPNREKRNAENAPNRRVMIFLFKPGSKIEPSRWPCPRAKEGIAGCKRWISQEGEARRSTRHPTERREIDKGDNTFGCIKYIRWAIDSPCEGWKPEPPSVYEESIELGKDAIGVPSVYEESIELRKDGAVIPSVSPESIVLSKA